MTRKEVIEWLEFMQENEHNKADGIVPCTTEIALGIAIEALKQPEIIRCKDCIHGGIDSASYPHYWCSPHSEYHEADWFCADGERRTDDA